MTGFSASNATKLTKETEMDSFHLVSNSAQASGSYEGVKLAC